MLQSVKQEIMVYKELLTWLLHSGPCNIIVGGTQLQWNLTTIQRNISLTDANTDSYLTQNSEINISLFIYRSLSCKDFSSLVGIHCTYFRFLVCNENVFSSFSIKCPPDVSTKFPVILYVRFLTLCYFYNLYQWRTQDFADVYAHFVLCGYFGGCICAFVSPYIPTQTPPEED